MVKIQNPTSRRAINIPRMMLDEVIISIYNQQTAKKYEAYRVHIDIKNLSYL
ncbi:hypothetical protein CC2G_011253 [Coprinopsis cinerea AmutBmut pab1-1]|nr:hypothetical protein CC2G_004858 [Coprinopsis cinerea AmutBmut pab1-1]KAG2011103.1 hypothetical protein CC2G_011253 [Coprinopsis cinerea AmutBmut pab1-1]